jgi:formylaminopyrimidine deformylase / aminopyrimidine aminohydrolase
LCFQAQLLARAPRPAQAVLAGGLVALEAELTWFEQHATRRRLTLDGERVEATQAYRASFERLVDAGYGAAIVALWALERAYLEAWQSARPGAPAFREFVEHWTVPAFAEYVARLERAADAALAGTTAEAAERAFVDIAQLERAFWDMAFTESVG